MISNRQQHIPVTELIEQLNRHLRGWKNYYGKWHCGAAMKRINWQVENRLRKHLRRRSQRPWRIPKGSTLMAQLRVPLSLEPKRTLSQIHHFQLSRWASQALPVADILNSPCVLKTSKKQFLNFCRAKTVDLVESSKLISQAVSEHQSA
jgi:hypothetical protein